MSDPLKCIPLDDDKHSNGIVVIDRSIYEEPDPEQALKAYLHDTIHVAYGDTVEESLENLAKQLERTADKIRQKAKEQ